MSQQYKKSLKGHFQRPRFMSQAQQSKLSANKNENLYKSTYIQTAKVQNGIMSKPPNYLENKFVFTNHYKNSQFGSSFFSCCGKLYRSQSQLKLQVRRIFKRTKSTKTHLIKAQLQNKKFQFEINIDFHISENIKFLYQAISKCLQIISLQNYQQRLNNINMERHPFLKITQFQQLNNHQKPLSMTSRTVFDSKFVFKFTDKKQIHTSRSDKINFSQQVKSLFTSLLEKPPQSSRSKRQKIQFDIKIQSKSLTQRQPISTSLQRPVKKLRDRMENIAKIKSSHKICPISMLEPCKINSMNLNQRNTADRTKNNFRNRRRNMSRSMVSAQIQKFQRESNRKAQQENSTKWEKDLTLTPWMKQDESKLDFI